MMLAFILFHGSHIHGASTSGSSNLFKRIKKIENGATKYVTIVFNEGTPKLTLRPENQEDPLSQLFMIYRDKDNIHVDKDTIHIVWGVGMVTKYRICLEEAIIYDIVKDDVRIVDHVGYEEEIDIEYVDKTEQQLKDTYLLTDEKLTELRKKKQGEFETRKRERLGKTDTYNRIAGILGRAYAVLERSTANAFDSVNYVIKIFHSLKLAVHEIKPVSEIEHFSPSHKATREGLDWRIYKKRGSPAVHFIDYKYKDNYGGNHYFFMEAAKKHDIDAQLAQEGDLVVHASEFSNDHWIIDDNPDPMFTIAKMEGEKLKYTQGRLICDIVDPSSIAWQYRQSVSVNEIPPHRYKLYTDPTRQGVYVAQRIEEDSIHVLTFPITAEGSNNNGESIRIKLVPLMSDTNLNGLAPGYRETITVAEIKVTADEMKQLEHHLTRLKSAGSVYPSGQIMNTL